VTLHSFRLEQHEAEQSLAPYPFYQAYSLEGGVEALGDPSEWLAEWKWDGIRVQTVLRHGKLAIWSRGEELVTESFPELAKLVELLPNGTVIDGEIVAQRDGTPAPFGLLQPRLDRKRVTKKHVEEFPVAIVAYDLLEVDGIDIRDRSLSERRAALEILVKSIEDPLVPLSLSAPIAFQQWPELTEARRSSRERSAEGLILKRLDSSYSGGRQSGEWWKWEVDPHTCHGVLMYAEKGNGKRADLFTDYTFGVWRGDDLVPFAKAFSGLTDKEIREVDSYIKSHTREKFGPVRLVDPELVFEIAFESVQLSSRHKSGISVRSPRILRWRRGKPAHEAGELSTLLELAVGGSSARDLIT
jgi:DNA ligase-1